MGQESKKGKDEKFMETTSRQKESSPDSLRHWFARHAARAELHPALWIGLPFLLFVLLIVWSFSMPEMALEAFRDDTEGGGIMEHGTVFFLVLGMLAGLVAVFRYDEVFHRKALKIWVLLWVAGALYFAGEEASWGQHYFKWDAPEIMEEHNKQNETNLHNTSSWLNQKPRLLLEFWILFGGLALPLWRGRNGRNPYYGEENDWSWFWPSVVCLPITALIALLRIFEVMLEAVSEHTAKLDYFDETFASAELREYHLAIFIFLYLLSIVARARQQA